MVLVAFLYMIIASTFTIGKLALQYLQPIFFVGIRMVFSGLLLLGYLYFFRRFQLIFRREDRWSFLSIILFHIFFSFVAEFWALQYLNSSKVCLFYSLSPFIAAVFSYFLFSEKMTFKKFIGLAIGFCAFLPVFISNADAGQSAVWFLSWPELAMLLSVVSATYGWTVVRKLGRSGYSMFMINGIGMLGGGLLSLVASFIFEGWPTIRSVSGSLPTDLLASAGYTLLLIVLANVVFYNLYGHLLHRYTVTFISFAGFTTPLFAALYGWVLLGESVGVSFFITVLLVSIGLYIFYQEELRQGYIVSR